MLVVVGRIRSERERSDLTPFPTKGRRERGIVCRHCRERGFFSMQNAEYAVNGGGRAVCDVRYSFMIVPRAARSRGFTLPSHTQMITAKAETARRTEGTSSWK